MEEYQTVHRMDTAAQFQNTDKSQVQLGSREAHCRECLLMTPSRVSAGTAVNRPAIALLRGKTSSKLKVHLGGSHWSCRRRMPHCLINPSVL